jgi:hypothetical protein
LEEEEEEEDDDDDDDDDDGWRQEWSSERMAGRRVVGEERMWRSIQPVAGMALDDMLRRCEEELVFVFTMEYVMGEVVCVFAGRKRRDYSIY